ncbi:2Fe-2S iron-sulfur cluster-binding protein [Natronolimnohabitans sp. A-GB9]|uniref:2Fe-2S iron-sulfur cluster-binding protein n=1 Tax=Natronolimnohabitans sp. A-GB9 TaxID=3069757 RepID=UPI0027B7D1C7|nr:2Fe-2S iron-sulfur cluster-binding protein [Natronolimnohabitans sp. A-GB9]MDQ2049412.1 2Fe-2S iron-sulfur cluster-binding protein [Natronolimnohabitans sp. A-GB9]
MSDRPTCTGDDTSDGSPTTVTVPSDMPTADRRQLLAAIGGAGAVAVAGCMGENDDTDEDVDVYEIEFPEEDETVEVASDEDILQPALDAGVEIPYACEVGTCGDCTARYDGDATDVVTHDGNEYLEDDQIEDGWVLTCVAFPEEDFELEIAHPDDE